MNKRFSGILPALLLLSACAPDNTQLVVTIDSDLKAGTELGAVQVRLIKDGEIAEQSRFNVRAGDDDNPEAFTLPLSFAVTPPAGDASAEVTFDIVAMDASGQGELFTRRVISGFRQGSRLLVPVFLSADCVTTASQCTGETTCTELGCASPVVDVTMLNEVDPGQEVNATIRMMGNNANADAGVVPPGNDPPTAPEIELSTTATGTLGRVEVNITQAATDPDNDAVTYRYRWSKNGELQGDPQVAELTAGFTTKGEVWRVDVYANDGFQDSLMAASATVSITNTAPSVTLTFTSSVVRSTDLLEVSANIEDPDNDAVDLSFAWTKNSSVAQTSTAALGRPGTQTASVAAEMLTRGDVWSAQITVSDGEDSAQASTDALTILSAPPVVDSVLVTANEARPRTTSQLQVSYTTSDPDPGDTLSRIEIEWRIDGQVVPGADGVILAPSYTQKHQRITATVRAYDQDNVGSVAVTSAELEIENTPPTTTIPSILPKTAGVAQSNNLDCQSERCTTANDFQCIPGTYYDADGDPEVHRYNWYRNELIYSLFLPVSEISGQSLTRGMVVFCTAEAFDGEDAGTSRQSASIYIDNARPTFTDLDVAPTSPREGQTITATVAGWFDADGDPEQYNFIWYVNGVEKNLSGPQLDSSHFDKGDQIRVKAIAYDLFENGHFTFSSTITAVNTAPSIGLVRVTPQTVYTGTEVQAQPLGWFDPDPADLEDYRYEWFINGQVAAGQNGFELPATVYARGDQIVARVLPFDGEQLGTAALSSTITVQNTPPLPPRIRVGPAAPVAAENLNCTIVAPSLDADNDNVSYTYAWKKNSELTSETSSVVLASATSELDIWTCEVTPYDGADAGRLALDTTIVRPASNSLAPAAIHASGGETCIIQRSPAGILCWEYNRVWPFLPGNFSGFVQSISGYCALDDQSQLVCPTISGTPNIGSIPSHWTLDGIVNSGTNFGYCFLETSGEVACMSPNPSIPPGPFTQIVGGSGFGCGLRTDQTIRCWGSNANNRATPPSGTFVQLREGHFLTEALSTSGEWVKWGDNAESNGLNYVPTVQNEIKRVAGNRAACALGADGTALCASNLGTGQGVDAVPNALFSDIAVGTWHACGVTLDGEVLCWGSELAPLQVAQGAPQGFTLTKVAVGDKFACGLEAGGRLRCWGNTNTDTFPNDGGLYTLGHGQTYVDVWAKANELCAKRDTGEIDCFGERFQKVKQVALARTGRSQDAPYSNALILASGMSFRTENQDNDSRVRARCDRIGPRGGSTSMCLSPGQIGHFAASNANTGGNRSLSGVIDGGVGEQFYCGLFGNGTIECWGDDNSNRVTNRPIVDPANPFTQVSAGAGHACALKQDGSIACWGSNNSGVATPPTPLPGNPFTSISSGDAHSCALLQDGTYAWCWGSNATAQLNAPVLTTSNPYTQASAGAAHNCALKQDGSIFCWGLFGTPRSTPPALDPSNPFVQVSAGYEHSCAVKQDGSIVCWGDAAQFSNLIQHGLVPNDQNTGFAFGPKHHCSLRPNGSAECKGENDVGQATPPAGSFVKLFARDKQSCGIRPGGAVECWGENSDLQGDAPAGYNFIEIGLAPRHACGIATNTSTSNTNPNTGGIICWGYNGDGRYDLPTNMQNRHDFVDVDCTDDSDCGALATDGTTNWFGLTPDVSNANEQNVSQMVWDSSYGCTLSLTGQPFCLGYDGDPYISRSPPVYVTP